MSPLYAFLIIIFLVAVSFLLCLFFCSIGLFWALVTKVGIYVVSRSVYIFLIKMGLSGGLGLVLGIVLALLTAEGSGSPNTMMASGSVSGSGGEVNPHSASHSASWTSLLGGSLPETETEETRNPSVNQPTDNAGAPPGPGEEAAGPAHYEPYPYQLDEVIGGDSVRSIQRRLLAEDSCPSAAIIDFTQIEAQDLFEVKVDIIRWMAPNDPAGDWEGRGARALDNPRTATGEESFEKLTNMLTDLNQHGVDSQTFHSLKGKVFLKRENLDEHSGIW